jgi:hypothetical protein
MRRSGSLKFLLIDGTGLKAASILIVGTLAGMRNSITFAIPSEKIKEDR